MTIGFGIVGCGMIAKFHARALREVPGTRLVGCYSRRFEVAQEFAGEFDCRAFESLDELLAQDDVHVINLCTPSGAHLEPGVAAARKGKHLLVEKPLEITEPRCDALIAECQEHGVRLATIFPSRFHGCWQAVKDAIDQKRFGRIALGSAYVKWFRSQEYYDQGAWRGTWELDGGGALMNQAIHTIDLLQWLLGPVDSLAATTQTLGHERIEVEDVAAAVLKFCNGAIGVIEATTCSFPGMLKKIEIHGTTGSVVVEEEQITHWEFKESRDSDASVWERFGKRSTSAGGASDPAAIGHHGHARLFAEFVRALAENRSSLLDGAEGRKSVEIIRGIYRAAETGEWVSIG
jgi:UDP-N-acetyl-2-amino-2-deoxyglucuronate dehydrogenase